MCRKQPLHGSGTSAPPATSRSFTGHQSLRINATDDIDSFESPWTTEKLARLKAALLQCKRSKSSDDLPQGEGLLLPPTTAERFILIESAIGVPFTRPSTSARIVSIAPGPRTSTLGTSAVSRSGTHVLRKRSLRAAEQRSLPRTQDSANITSQNITSKSPAEHSSENENENRVISKTMSRDFAIESTRPSPTFSRMAAGLLPPVLEAFHKSKEDVRRRSDIFQSNEAAEKFANQTYCSAKEKYFDCD